MNWYLKVIKQYADFKGRARRKEYWMFYLFNAIILALLIWVDRLTGTFNEHMGSGLASGVYSVFALIPSLAVGVRRLHDVGKSGWILLLILIPIIGWVWILALFISNSEYGSNQYGPNPKGDG